MIRTNSEYVQAVEQLTGFRSRLDSKREELNKLGLTEEQITKLTEPEVAFYDQISDEIASYDRLRRGDHTELSRYGEFQDTGKLLIALRILKGMSQSNLANALEVDPSQVSRDERNEYSGITLQRILKILSVLGVQLVSRPTNLTQNGRELECV